MCFDEPFAGVVSSYFLSQLIARHVKVALAGDGADELFGSYLSHRLAQPLANYSRYLETGDPDLIRPFEECPAYLASLLDEAAAPAFMLWSDPAFMPWADDGVLVVLVACAVAAPAATRKARPMLAERIDWRVFRGDMRCS